MTPEQALQILENASGLAPLPRNEHIAIQQAINVLKGVLATLKTNAQGGAPDAALAEVKP